MIFDALLHLKSKRSDWVDGLKLHARHSGSEDSGLKIIFRTPDGFLEFFGLQILAFFDQRFDESSEPVELNIRSEALNSAK